MQPAAAVAAALLLLPAAGPAPEGRVEAFGYVGGTGNEAQAISLTCTGAVQVGVGIVCFLVYPGEAEARFVVHDAAAGALGGQVCALAEFHDAAHAPLLVAAFLGDSGPLGVPARATHVLVSPTLGPEGWELCGAGAPLAASAGTIEGRFGAAAWA